ncbi:hypothetical protein BC629DRAFT_1443192 [Irpex lacteus]|nr:hypothetical protein BC629DRAFT_1443192 [Irpex lacteus]
MTIEVGRSSLTCTLTIALPTFLNLSTPAFCKEFAYRPDSSALGAKESTVVTDGARPVRIIKGSEAQYFAHGGHMELIRVGWGWRCTACPPPIQTLSLFPSEVAVIVRHRRSKLKWYYSPQTALMLVNISVVSLPIILNV